MNLKNKILSIEDGTALLKEEQRIFTETERIPIEKSLHKILAQDISSNIAVPNFRRSAMDGYAVHTKDFKNFKEYLECEILDTLYAGDFKEISHIKNSCVQIMTGAYVPDDFNAVIKQEETEIFNNKVKIFKNPQENRHILRIGEDIDENTLLAKKGERITPAHIGVFASLGIEKIEIVKSPKITFISTGSELICPGEPLEKGKIYNSTIYHLSSYAKERGLLNIKLLQVEDSLESLSMAFLEEAKNSDIVITTGGVSVGEKDYIPEAVKKANGELLFHGIAMRPGHPVKASKIENTIFLHTSGSPFAAFANFQVFFWPLIEKYFKSSSFKLKKMKGTISKGFAKKSPFQRLVRCSIDHGEVQLFSKNFSSSISNLIKANGFILQEKDHVLKVGDQVEVFYLHLWD